MGRSFLFVLSTLLHALVAWRLGESLPVAAAVVLWVVMAASAVLMPLALAARGGDGSKAGLALAWAGMLFMGLFSSLFVLTVLRDLALLGMDLARLAVPAINGTPGLDVLALSSAIAVIVIALGVTALGFFNARRTAAVVKIDIPVAGLPAALEGFAIAQLSDVHIGPTIRRKYLEAIVARTNTLNADVVAITGDLVDGSVHQLAGHVAPLAQLVSRYGTFFVTGNHEYYSGAHSWIAELRRVGLTVLLNEHVVIERDGARLVLAGVTDSTAHLFDPLHKTDPFAAVAGAPAKAPRVLLAHQPRSSAEAAAAGFDVQLSGHTHGGQFWPWNLFVPMQQPFVAGLHRVRDLWVYTSRGTGYWGPPKRFGAPSEITLIRLVRAS